VAGEGRCAQEAGKLRDLLRAEGVTNAIIFCNRKTTVRELNKSLRQRLLQRRDSRRHRSERPDRELDRFKSGEDQLSSSRPTSPHAGWISRA
jgi:superfamily II DNA/RNA helicase